MPDTIPVNNQSSQSVISDLPEYVKPYYKMLLNATASQVYAPEFVASQVGSQQQIPTQNPYQPPPQQPYPGANPYPGPQQAPPPLPYQPTGPAPQAPAPIAQPGQPAAPAPMIGRGGMDGNARGQSAGDAMQQILGDRIFGARRMASGGRVDPMLQAAALAAASTTQPAPSVLGGDVSTTGIGAFVTPGTPTDQRIIAGGGGSRVSMIGPSGPPLPGSPGSTPGTGPVIPGGFYAGNTTADGHLIGSGSSPGGYNPGGAPTGGPMSPKDWRSVAVPPTPSEQATINAALANYARAGHGGGEGLVIPGSSPGGSTRNVSVTTPGGLNVYDAALTNKMNSAQLQAGLDYEQAAARGEIPGLGNYKGHAAGGIIRLAMGGSPYNFGGGDPGAGTTPGLPGFGTVPNTNTPATSSAPVSGGGVFQPYQPYQGQRLLSSDPNINPSTTWGISDRTRAAEAGMANMPTNMFTQAGTFNNPVMKTAGAMIEQAGNRAGDVYQNLSGVANQFDRSNTQLRSNYQQQAYDPGSFSTSAVDPNRQGLGSSGSVQMDPFNMYQAQGPETWNSGIMNSYMSPYQQGVVDVQKQRASQDYANQQQYRDDAAIHAGAYGGSRQAVANSLAHRNLQDELANIQATGSQSAFGQAQQQFNADRASQQAAGQTNLGAAITQQQQSNAAQLAAAQGNQQARLSEFGTVYGGNLQAQLANQKAQLDAQNLAEQSRQFGANFGDKSAQFADTQSMAGQEASARTQLAALQQSVQATGQQNTTGANFADLFRLNNQIQGSNLQAQQGAGAIEDQRRQAQLDMGYQDFINAQNHPFQLANFESGILHGIPQAVNTEGTQLTQYKPNTTAQIIGGIAGIGGQIASGWGK